MGSQGGWKFEFQEFVLHTEGSRKWETAAKDVFKDCGSRAVPGNDKVSGLDTQRVVYGSATSASPGKL